MLDLETKLNIKELIESPNIVKLLSAHDLTCIAKRVIDEYTIDLQSRSEWETKNKEALELALQIVEQKTTPWVGAANIKFPLITIAALQCHAREYPALLNGTEIVKCRVIGEDKTGAKCARAKRISAHMSYQILEEDTNWEEQMDRVLFTKPIVGTTFKKVYFDPTLGHNVSEMILAQHLVIPYYARSLEKAVRKTHVIEITQNELYERVARGIFIESSLDLNARSREQTQLQEVADKVQGMNEVAGDMDAPVTILEQHRYLDLDGDGYAEPYIVTVDEKSEQVLRIKARYFEDDITYLNGKIVSIRAQEYFIKYGMIPSPDGGIYDLGFGSLLGPLNHTVNTLINQLLDAGTLSNLGGGFLGRGAKLRRGQNQFVPGEWKQVDSAGQDLRNSVVPLPIKEPSQVLFALLGMLVNYSERISGATDIMSGQNVGQNTPATTAQELVKQGSVIFNSLFKRDYRSLKNEFRALYRLNQLYLQNNKEFENLSTGDSALILHTDYLGKETDVRPSADPNIASVEQRMQQAILLKQAAAAGPGYKAMAVEKRFLEAAQIPYIQEVWDERNVPQPQVDVKLQIAQLNAQLASAEMRMNTQIKIMELMQQDDKIRAEVVELQARAIKELKEAQGVAADNAVNLINAQIQARKHRQDSIIQTIKVLKEIMDSSTEKGGMSGTLQGQSAGRGTAGMAAPSGNEGDQEVPTGLGGGVEEPMG